MSNFTDFISSGGGGSASQINEVVTLNNSDDIVTLADGRVYLKGGVFETTLSTYPNAYINKAPVGINFSTASQGANPNGIAWDGNFFWVLFRQSGNNLFKYNSSGVYQNTSINMSNWGTDVKGVVWDGTNFTYIGGTTMSKYTSAGSYTGLYSNIASQTTSARGMAWDGTYYYVIENGGSRNVFKYNSSMVYQSVAFSVNSETTDPRAITWDGTYFWVTSSTSNNKAFKYNSSGVYQNESLSLLDTYPEGIVSKGGGDSSLFVSGPTLDKVVEYKPANGVASVSNLGGQNYVRVA